MSHDDDGQEPAELARGGTIRGSDPGTCSGCGGPAHRIWVGETPHWWHNGEPCDQDGARFVAARQAPESPRDRQHPRAPRDRQQPPPGRDR